MNERIELQATPMRLLFMFLGGIALLFIIAPLLALYLHASPVAVAKGARETAVQNSIWLTLWLPLAATIVCAIFAIPLSWILARRDFPLKPLVNALIDLPLVLPHPAAGIALLWVFAARSFPGNVLNAAGLRFIGNPMGIATAMAFVSLPFLINAARDGFSAVPSSLEATAAGLGASPWRVFFTISLPLARKSILSGGVTMWARGMSEFGAVIVVAYHPMTAPVMIWERLNAFGLSSAMPVTVLFVTICLILFAVFRFFGGRK